MGTTVGNLKVKSHQPHSIPFQTLSRHNTCCLMPVLTTKLNQNWSLISVIFTGLRFIYLAFTKHWHRDKECFCQAPNSLLTDLCSSAIWNEEMETNRDLRHNREAQCRVMSKQSKLPKQHTLTDVTLSLQLSCSGGQTQPIFSEHSLRSLHTGHVITFPLYCLSVLLCH